MPASSGVGCASGATPATHSYARCRTWPSSSGVLRCLDRTDVPSPTPYWYEPDPNVLGAPALLMERVPGECPSPWRRSGREYYAAAAERGLLPESFTDSLAAIHNVDWQAAGLDFLGVPDPGDDFARREILKWQTLIEESGHPGHPILDDLRGWLEANAPATDRLTLVHGAYRTGNVLIHDDRVSAVLDWELQVIGDPMYDVAYMLTELNREGTDLLSNVVPRDLFYERYQSATGTEIDDDRCRYYQLLYAMRSAAFWMSAAGPLRRRTQHRPPPRQDRVVGNRCPRTGRPGVGILSHGPDALTPGRHPRRQPSPGRPSQWRCGR